MGILIHLLATSLAILLSAYVVPGIEISGFSVALIAAVCLGLFNLLVKPLIFLLTLPINIITFGLFSFVVNALLFWLAAVVLDGFEVAGFLAALLGSIIVSVVSSLTRELIK
jgi:putative membrane protein